MEKIIFNNEECYIAFKVFDNENLLNYRGNFTYETNNWYKSLDVDMSDKEDSYGLYLFKNEEKIKEFNKNRRIQCLILKCFVPIESNKIKFFKNENEFRCQRFYLSDKVVYNDDEFFCNLSEEQKNRICINNQNFNVEKHWSELSEDQKNLVCEYNPNFDYEKLWPIFSEPQRNIICAYRKNFNYEKYKGELTKEQSYIICAYNKTFDYEKYWDELTEYQKYFVKCRIVIKVV